MSVKSFAGKLIVPAVGVGTFFAVRKNEKLNGTQKAGIVAGTSLLTYLIRRTYLSYKGGVPQVKVDYGQIPYIGYDATGRPVKWDADPLAQAISRNIEGYNVIAHPEVTNKILTLNDAQIKALYNHYNRYYAKDAPTLTQLLQNEWYADIYYARPIQKLKQLGLSQNGPKQYALSKCTR
jgi:hypothetical protein